MYDHVRHPCKEWPPPLVGPYTDPICRNILICSINSPHRLIIFVNAEWLLHSNFLFCITTIPFDVLLWRLLVTVGCKIYHSIVFPGDKGSRIVCSSFLLHVPSFTLLHNFLSGNSTAFGDAILSQRTRGPYVFIP